MGISFRGLERDLRWVFTKIQKKWLMTMVRKAKGGKLQKRRVGTSVERVERGWGP